MNPKVSVCMIAYNQEKFIGQAIESVLMQEAEFEYELVIGEDCSKDQTRTILEEYQGRYPDRVRLLDNEQNMGATRNLARTMEQCRGQYIALLEGDDYWTSPVKLQKQADFLDENSDCSSCYHATQMIDRYNRFKTILPVSKFRKHRSTLQDLIVNDSFMATCSIMFRNHLFDKYPLVLFTSNLIADWSLNVLNAQHGLIGYLDEEMSVYRSSSSEGAFTARSRNVAMHEAIKINEAFNEYLGFKYDEIIKRKIVRYYYGMALGYLFLGDVKQ